MDGTEGVVEWTPGVSDPVTLNQIVTEGRNRRLQLPRHTGTDRRPRSVEVRLLPFLGGDRQSLVQRSGLYPTIEALGKEIGRLYKTCRWEDVGRSHDPFLTTHPSVSGQKVLECLVDSSDDRGVGWAHFEESEVSL